MEKLRSIKEWYEYALKDPDIHACTTMDLSTVNIDHLFSGNNSKKFIRNYFEYLYSDPSSVNPAGKFVDNIERITDFRAQHATHIINYKDDALPSLSEKMKIKACIISTKIT